MTALTSYNARHDPPESQEDPCGCPVARTTRVIGNKWTPLIVRDLGNGERRFSELARSLTGISPKTLTERLKYLEAIQVIRRRCYAEVPPRVVYSLTEKGYALLPVIESMREYGLHWLAEAHHEPVTNQRVERYGRS